MTEEQKWRNQNADKSVPQNESLQEKLSEMSERQERRSRAYDQILWTTTGFLLGVVVGYLIF